MTIFNIDSLPTRGQGFIFCAIFKFLYLSMIQEMPFAVDQLIIWTKMTTLK